MSGLGLGYSISSSIPADRSPNEAAGSVLDRVRVAADAGYDVVEAGDHHAVDGDGYLQNVPMAARLTEHFDRVAVMFLLPLYHPVLVAEQVGTLDALAEDVDFWGAVGYGEAAFSAFGVQMAERAPRFEEALALIEGLWTDDGVTFDGEFYQVAETSVNPKADPRICIGGSARPAVERAARLGDAWVANVDVAGPGLERRIRTIEEVGDGDVDVIVRRDGLVLEDCEVAESAAREQLEAGYRGWGPEADWLLVGDADSVAEELAALEAVGADEVVVRPMTAAHAEETLREVARARGRL